MLAHMPNEIAHVDGLSDLYAATVRQCIVDLRRGPGHSLKQQHDYATAMEFLRQAGLLDRVMSHYQLVSTPCQLDLFMID